MGKSEMVLAKTFSARWLMAIMFSVTACVGFLLGRVPTDAFIPILGVVVTFYFSKSPVDNQNKTETKINA